MSPTIAKALAHLKAAPTARQEEIAKIILSELGQAHDAYQDMVDRELTEGLEQADAGLGIPMEHAIPKLKAEMSEKYGSL